MKRILLFSAFIMLNALVSCTADDAAGTNETDAPINAEGGIGGQGGGTPIPPPPPPPPPGP